MCNLYLEFEVKDKSKFKMLQKIFTELKKDKEHQELDCENDKWLDFYDEEDLVNNFWWPTEKELKEHWELFYSIEESKRCTDKRLKVPWDFESMLDAISCGEYELHRCQMTKENIGKLEFIAWAWPYGGANSLKALVESFGFEVIREEV